MGEIKFHLSSWSHAPGGRAECPRGHWPRRRRDGKTECVNCGQMLVPEIQCAEFMATYHPDLMPFSCCDPCHHLITSQMQDGYVLQENGKAYLVCCAVVDRITATHHQHDPLIG